NACVRGDKLLARHLRHCGQHAFVLDAARLQLLLDHPLALLREIESCRSLLAAPRRSYRSKKQILRDDSHRPKDNAVCANAKAAPLLSSRIAYRTAVTAFM